MPLRFLATSPDSVGVNEECQRLGYHIVTSQVDESAMKNPLGTPMVHERRIDGLILAGPAIKPSFILELYNSGLPVVLLDHSLRGTDIDCILHENETSVYRLTQHLIQEHQYRNIAFLSGPRNWLSSAERADGYRRALNDASLQPNVFYMQNTIVETGMEAMETALSQVPNLDAVVCVNDAVAVGAIRTCKSAGKSVPEQIAVVGFDNIGWSQLHEPPLTTVHAFGEEMGRQAARRLIELITADPGQEHVRLRLRVSTKLIIRRSCGCDAHE